MNWGTGIAALICAFLAGMIGMVIAAVSQNYDLVADNYYEQEVQYQRIINQKKNALQLAERPVWEYAPQSGLTLRFPAGAAVRQGIWTLYRPSDRKLDRSAALQLSERGEQSIASEQLRRGPYTLQLDWEDAEGRRYTIEQEIEIP